MLSVASAALANLFCPELAPQLLNNVEKIADRRMFVQILQTSVVYAADRRDARRRGDALRPRLRFCARANKSLMLLQAVRTVGDAFGVYNRKFLRVRLHPVIFATMPRGRENADVVGASTVGGGVVCRETVSSAAAATAVAMAAVGRNGVEAASALFIGVGGSNGGGWCRCTCDGVA